VGTPRAENEIQFHKADTAEVKAGDKPRQSVRRPDYPGQASSNLEIFENGLLRRLGLALNVREIAAHDASLETAPSNGF
jgi:hypothetical protein